MSKETRIQDIVRKAGYEPLENRAIVVSYAPANLSDAVAKFFVQNTQYFALQICRNELVFVPYGRMSFEIKRSHSLHSIFKDQGHHRRPGGAELPPDDRN